MSVGTSASALEMARAWRSVRRAKEPANVPIWTGLRGVASSSSSTRCASLSSVVSSPIQAQISEGAAARLEEPLPDSAASPLRCGLIGVVRTPL